MSLHGSIRRVSAAAGLLLLAAVLREPVLRVIAAEPQKALPSEKDNVDDIAATLRVIRIQRRDALRGWVEAAKAAKNSPPVAWGHVAAAPLVSAQGELLDGELELAESPAERIKACRAAIETLSGVEVEFYGAAVVTGHTANLTAYLQAKAARLKAEERLFVGLSKSRRPGDGPLVLAPRCNAKERSIVAAVERAGGRILVDEKQPDTPVVRLSFSGPGKAPDLAAAADAVTAANEATIEPAEPGDSVEVPALPPADFLPPLPLSVPMPAPVPPTPFIPEPAVPGSGLLPAPPGVAGGGTLSGGQTPARLIPALPAMPVSEATVQLIGQLKNLISLDLCGAEVTDASLKYLAGLEKLEELDLSGSPITEKGLKPLFPMPLKQLKMLDLSDTKVSEAFVVKLRKALPETEIIFANRPKTATRAASPPVVGGAVSGAIATQPAFMPPSCPAPPLLPVR